MGLRVDTLLIDYMGAEDTEYVVCDRKWLCGQWPGLRRYKFDYMLVLTGEQAFKHVFRLAKMVY